MEHTKLRYEYSDQCDAWVILDEKDRMLSYHCSEEHAKSLVKAVNSHDELVATLKNTAAYLKESQIPTDQAIRKMIEQALAKID